MISSEKEKSKTASNTGISFYSLSKGGECDGSSPDQLKGREVGVGCGSNQK